MHRHRDQISAVRAALVRVVEEILREYIHHCAKHAMTNRNKADQNQKIEKLIAVIARSKARAST